LSVINGLGPSPQAIRKLRLWVRSQNGRSRRPKGRERGWSQPVPYPPARVRGRAPAAERFPCILEVQYGVSRNLLGANSGWGHGPLAPLNPPIGYEVFTWNDCYSNRSAQPVAPTIASCRHHISSPSLATRSRRRSRSVDTTLAAHLQPPLNAL